MRNIILKFIRTKILSDLMYAMKFIDNDSVQKSGEYLEWEAENLMLFTSEFVNNNKLFGTKYILEMNSIYNTQRFDNLIQRWIVEYLHVFFRVLDDYSHGNGNLNITLEDNPLNRFAFEKYAFQFAIDFEVVWKKQDNTFVKCIRICFGIIFTIVYSLVQGLKLVEKRKDFKILREGIWGLDNVGGKYFHDDFLVDGVNLKQDDMLFFSRGVPTTEFRLTSYKEMRNSVYSYFDLKKIPISLKVFFLRIVPLYVNKNSYVLLKEIYSKHFSLFWNIYLTFVTYAVPYERVFSNYDIVSELGHNYFSYSHISEAIVCENYGVKYYLMHWSDNSLKINSYITSFLGCDNFLVWGSAHIQTKSLDPKFHINTGYVFKEFIQNIQQKREHELLEMGVNVRGKVISFFDESVGGECKMTGAQFVDFWKCALNLARKEPEHTILLKPKEYSRYKLLSDELQCLFLEIKAKLENQNNVYIINEDKWSFIEVIGVSDIVITQGATSSATIAIICGIEGLYLDQAHYDHPFWKDFSNVLMFDDPSALISMVQSIITGESRPRQLIPESTLRKYDAFNDNCALNRYRSILLRGKY